LKRGLVVGQSLKVVPFSIVPLIGLNRVSWQCFVVILVSEIRMHCLARVHSLDNQRTDELCTGSVSNDRHLLTLLDMCRKVQWR